MPVAPAVVAPAVVAPPTGNGKGRGKAKGKDKAVEVTPLAETIAPANPVATVETVVPTTLDVPVVASDDDKHGRGHDKEKDK